MKVPILGVSCTKFGEWWNKSLSDLLAEAAYGALADASLLPKDIDSVFVANMCGEFFSGQGHLGSLVAHILNRNVPSFRIESACASGGAALAAGVQAILSGNAQVVLVCGVEKMTDFNNGYITDGLMAAADRESEFFAGATIPGLFALIARYYMHTYGVERSQVAAVSVKNHAHALLNPLAHLSKKITVDDVLAAPMVADPLGLLDCSPVSDGAAAIILSSADFAKKKGLVSVVASSLATDTLLIGQRSSWTSFKATQLAAQKAYAVAGLSPDDIDIVELHDAFSMAEVIALEDLGFFMQGFGWQGALEKMTYLRGSLPVNVSGGLKAKGHPIGATGVAQGVEIVLQLRHQAGARQVADASVGLTHNMGGVGTSVAVHIFRSDNDHD